MKKYEKPYVKEMGIEMESVLAGSQLYDTNNNSQIETTTDEDIHSPKKIDIWD